jgi:hypothetical protein
MREEWTKWMAMPDSDLTLTGRMRRPSISQVCEWVKKSWETVKTETVVKSFKKCGISNRLDGTEDDILFEENRGDSSESSDIDSAEEYE